MVLNLLLAGRGNADPQQVSDPLGRRFSCKDTDNVCLTMLRPECRLILKHGGGIPAEPEDRLFLTRESALGPVEGSDQLKGCVKIANKDNAIEYLRFFSSLKTVHLFHDKNLEIFPSTGKSCFLVCLPRSRWQALKLTAPVVERTKSGFRVTRLVIRPLPNRQDVTIFRLTQDVDYDGGIREVEAVPIQLPRTDLLWLGFPSHL
jgi:hypothetical protein